MGSQKKIVQQIRHLETPLRMRRSFWMFWILLIGFTLRSVFLDIKPVHFDEGINGHFVQTIWHDGFYHYDPTNFHGPLFFYILALAERVFGWGIVPFRFVTGLINLSAVAVVGMHRRFVGKTAIFAALILAVSPAFVFYSRYAIHESLFILAQVAFSYGFLLYKQEKSVTSLWWMALAIVVMIATKETFFIFLVTWGIALACVHVYEKMVPSDEPKNLGPAPDVTNSVAVILVSAVILVALFTGFYLYMPGAADMLRGLQVWTNTGSAAKTGHEKPFLYWIELLQKYEWPSLIGLALSPFVFFARTSNRALKTIVLAGFGLWLAYSIIPYKTPWLLMNFIWLLAFSAGAVIARVIPAVRVWRGLRTGAAVLTFGAVLFSSAEMIRLNFRDYAKQGEPYVYVQSTEQFKTVVDLIFAHVKRVPQDQNMRLFAMNRDPWPMPYLFENFPNVAWGHADTIDIEPADVILTDFEDKAPIERRLKGSYIVMPFQIRDAYQQGQAYFRSSMFKDELPAGLPVVTGVSP